MTNERGVTASLARRRPEWAKAARLGPLADYLGDQRILEIGGGEPADVEPTVAEGSEAVVLAAFRLQDAADYRTTLRAWFRPVRVGGYLVIVVPHAFLYERQLALPSRWNPAQRRLYTPRSLLEEVEEALLPNSYRVRHLSDRDDGYDYRAVSVEPPTGESDIVLVLEKIAPPRWQPGAAPLPDGASRMSLATPDFQFEAPRTRVEVAARSALHRILIMKPDHLGDFIMGLAALERVRALFPAAEITIVVGSWNVDAARSLRLFDHVIPFDAFPANSSEEEVDVPGKAALFRATVTGEYDLAIDLRTDTDARFLLRLVNTRLRAGIGTRAQFPFLDIFLPLDFNRNAVERAQEDRLDHHMFASQGPVRRGDHRLVARADDAERDCAIIWGPYWPVRPGRYIFEPHIEFAADSGGLLMLDVSLDAVRVAQAMVEGPDVPRLSFEVAAPDQRFEFRVWTVEDMPAIDFSFFGGRLIREGAGSVLHQSEYLSLLVELVAMRLARTGMLQDVAAS